MKKKSKKVIRTAKPDLFGLAETANALGVERARIGKWRRKGILTADGTRLWLPEPVLRLAATPVYRRSDIKDLLCRIEEHGRLTNRGHS